MKHLNIYLVLISFSVSSIAFAQIESRRIQKGEEYRYKFSNDHSKFETGNNKLAFLRKFSLEVYPQNSIYFDHKYAIGTELPLGVNCSKYTYKHVPFSIANNHHYHFQGRDNSVTNREMFVQISALTFQNKNTVQYFLGVSQHSSSSPPGYHSQSYGKVRNGVVFGVNYYFKQKK